MTVVKGHATENDFVIIDDRDGELELSAALVRALCDRHAGHRRRRRAAGRAL